MTRCARLAACAWALLATAPALAQSFIADNELRRQLNDFNKEIAEVGRMTQNVASNQDRLRTDLVAISDLARDVREQVRATSRGAAGRQVELQDIETTREDGQTQLVRGISSGLARLDSLAKVKDARDYARALTAYDIRGQVSLAKSLLEGIIALGDRSPLVPAARHWLGRIQYEQGEFEEARATLNETLALHPGDHNEPETLHLLAEIAILTGRSGAASIQERIMRLHPHSLAASRLRASR